MLGPISFDEKINRIVLPRYLNEYLLILAGLLCKKTTLSNTFGGDNRTKPTITGHHKLLGN